MQKCGDCEQEKECNIRYELEDGEQYVCDECFEKSLLGQKKSIDFNDEMDFLVVKVNHLH